MKYIKHIALKLILFITFLLSVTYSFSQHNTSSFWQRVRYGGGIGLSFGDNFFSATLAPNAVYEFNHYVSLGIGLNGSYAKTDDYKATIVGGSILALFHPIREIQLSTEFEELHVARNFELDGGNLKDNYWYPALYLGVGYRTGAMVFGIRYDVLYDENKSIYSNALTPFFRFYF